MMLETERQYLTQNLFSLGEVFSLRGVVDYPTYLKEIEETLAWWRVYNPRAPYGRRGLSLTSLDGEMYGGPDLDSLPEYNRENSTELVETDFRTPTMAYRKLSCLHEIMHPFMEDIGRCHLIRLDEGGFFPPHRDALSTYGNCFRILSFLQNTGPEKMVFMYDGRPLQLQPRVPYVIDTRKVHSLFSFVRKAVILVMNVPITETNLHRVYDRLAVK